MKRNKTNLLTLSAICLGMSIAPTSCKMNEKDEVVPAGSKSSGSVTPSMGYSPCVYNQVNFDFYGGQTILQGMVSVTNDATNLYVTYKTTEGWKIGQTHLYVGTLEGLPANKSKTPIPGQFPYKNTFNPYVTEYTYTIPLSGLPACYIIAAHAETHKIVNGQTVQTETAWSYGTQFHGTNRWGWYSDYCTQSCDGDTGTDPGTDPGREG